MGHPRHAGHRAPAPDRDLRPSLWLGGWVEQEPGHPLCHWRSALRRRGQGPDQAGREDGDKAGDTRREGDAALQARLPPHRLEELAQGRRLLPRLVADRHLVRARARRDDGPRPARAAHGLLWPRPAARRLAVQRAAPPLRRLRPIQPKPKLALARAPLPVRLARLLVRGPPPIFPPQPPVRRHRQAVRRQLGLRQRHRVRRRGGRLRQPQPRRRVRRAGLVAHAGWSAAGAVHHCVRPVPGVHAAAGDGPAPPDAAE
mmetsp:Transcript_43166/g.143732  ORF Transcript_43166/g.143732 Transcript_43166/m.143732 type:complete len:258 (-) Transcript_43166:725-1498(-)